MQMRSMGCKWVDWGEVVIQMNSNFHFSEEGEKKLVRIRILSDVSVMNEWRRSKERKEESFRKTVIVPMQVSQRSSLSRLVELSSAAPSGVLTPLALRPSLL